MSISTNSAIVHDRITNVAKAIDAKFFATDIVPQDINSNRLATHRILITLSADSKVELSLDDTNWDALNEDVALKGNTLYEFYIDLEATDTLNLRAKSAITVKRCRIDQIILT